MMTILSFILLMMTTTLRAQIVTDVPCYEWGKYYASPVSCSVFYICAPIVSVLYAYECPPGMHFNPSTESCDYPFLIDPPCTLPGN